HAPDGAVRLRAPAKNDLATAQGRVSTLPLFLPRFVRACDTALRLGGTPSHARGRRLETLFRTDAQCADGRYRDARRACPDSRLAGVGLVAPRRYRAPDAVRLPAGPLCGRGAVRCAVAAHAGTQGMDLRELCADSR